MINLSLVKYVLVAAMRDRLIISMLLMFMVGASLSVFLGDSAIIEKDRFTLVFAAAGLRMASVFGLVLFVIFFVRRSFDSKDIEFLLSRPVGRVSLISSYAFAFAVLCITMSLAVGGVVSSIAPHLFGDGHVLWVISVITETIIMACVALFFSLYISSAASASMIVLGFYVLARMMGQLMGIIDSSLIEEDSILAMCFQVISVVIPRLDLMGQTSWLLYPEQILNVGIIDMIGQGVVFCALILCAAYVDLTRREF